MDPRDVHDPESLKQIYEQAQRFVNYVQQYYNNRPTAPQPPSRPDEPLITDLKFEPGDSFYALPELGYVEHPIMKGTSNSIRIAVGTIAWLHALDQIRTLGFPRDQIQMFLDESAEVVKRDALFDCWMEDSATGKRVNKVEYFCYMWPDPSRQYIRIAMNIRKIFQKIREQASGTNPFLPTNIEQLSKDHSIKPECPPRKFDFIDDDGNTWENFFRNFTEAKKKLVSVDPFPTWSWECRPPKGVDWIPSEYKHRFLKAFQLEKYYYIDPNLWKRYLLTLHDANPKNPDSKDLTLRDYTHTDENGKMYLIVPGSNNPSGVWYKVTLEELDMTKGSMCPEPKLANRPTLRSWCKLFDPSKDYYPLLYILLNVNVPAFLPQFTKTKYYSRIVYDVSFRGTTYRRLSADAPLSLFRTLMIRQYGGIYQPDEQFANCRQRFIDHVWKAIQESRLMMDKSILIIPPEYQEVLQALFDFTEDKTCYNPNKKMETMETATTPRVPLSRESVEKFQSDQLIYALKSIAEDKQLTFVPK